MNFTQTARGIVRMIAIAMAVAVPLAITIEAADARVGGGGSSGSRGSKTYSAPPSTNTAPGAAQPMNRTFTQPGSPGTAAAGAAAGTAAKGGMMGGMLGGLAMGFLGAGLLGMLFGGGLFSGLGGLSSIIGLLLQIALIVIVVRLAMSWWQRRHQPANAYASGPAPAAEGPGGQQTSFRSGLSGFGLGSNQPALEIQPADYEAFERLLVDIQTAYSNEDMNKLRTLASPEMATFFNEDMQQNRQRGQVNKVSGTKLLQGDLAEAWREGDTDYASVAMRFSMVDRYVDVASGRLISGSEQPVEVTEVWTFVRPRGSNWELSAIQQTN